LYFSRNVAADITTFSSQQISDKNWRASDQEIFRARLDLLRGWAIRRAIDQDRLQTLLGKYKGLEHEMIELASMAKDTTCRGHADRKIGSQPMAHFGRRL